MAPFTLSHIKRVKKLGLPEARLHAKERKQMPIHLAHRGIIDEYEEKNRKDAA